MNFSCFSNSVNWFGNARFTLCIIVRCVKLLSVVRCTKQRVSLIGYYLLLLPTNILKLFSKIMFAFLYEFVCRNSFQCVSYVLLHAKNTRQYLPFQVFFSLLEIYKNIRSVNMINKAVLGFLVKEFANKLLFYFVTNPLRLCRTDSRFKFGPSPIFKLLFTQIIHNSFVCK